MGFEPTSKVARIVSLQRSPLDQWASLPQKQGGGPQFGHACFIGLPPKKIV